VKPMSENTHISWADATWPITVGCSKVSPGCYGCFAMKDARRMEGNPNPKISSVYSGLVTKQNNGMLNWTGTVRTLPERLDWPSKWHDHRDIFVCSQSDLFHEDVPDEFIGRVFSAMWNYSWHTYYVLTKRPERLLRLLQEKPPEGLQDFNSTNFPHVFVGVSAEDQTTAEKRLPLLVQLPLLASQLFVSAEPLIGPLDLSTWINEIGWVIVGGESGKYARPMHPDWPKSLRDQCTEANIAYHFKQWGEFLPEELATERLPVQTTEQGTILYKVGLPKAGKGTPTVVQDGTTFYRVGRKKAGRVLDGKYWKARPGADFGPATAPHPIGSTVEVIGTDTQYDGLIGVIQTIVPDDPDNLEFEGEEAVYYIEVDGHEVPLAFSYWQLQPTA
jgi:protein gp37